MSVTPSWSRPPFEAGNDLAVTHGARSPRTVDPLAAALVVETLADASTPAFLRDPSYGPALAAWARAEVKVRLLSEHLDGLSVEAQMTPPRKGVTPPLEVLRRWEASAQNARARLGLDPMSRGRLLRDLSSSAASVTQSAALEAIAAAGRASRAGRDEGTQNE